MSNFKNLDLEAVKIFAMKPDGSGFIDPLCIISPPMSSDSYFCVNAIFLPHLWHFDDISYIFQSNFKTFQMED